MIFGNPEANILYYGFENLAQIGTRGGEKFQLSSENIEIRTVENGFLLVPQNKEKAVLYLNDPKSGKCFDSIAFDIRILPPPTLFFGSAADGEKVQLAYNALYALYDAYIPLIAKFEVKSYTLSTGNGKPYVVMGNKVVGEVMNDLKRLNKGETFTIVAKIVGPDGIIREVKGSYKL